MPETDPVSQNADPGAEDQLRCRVHTLVTKIYLGSFHTRCGTGHRLWVRVLTLGHRISTLVQHKCNTLVAEEIPCFAGYRPLHEPWTLVPDTDLRHRRHTTVLDIGPGLLQRL